MALIHYNPPTAPYLRLLHADEDLLVLDKPSGLLSVPGKAPEHKDSLQLRVQRVYPQATVVHRLDMATSGLMLFALNKASHRHISKQFELRQVHKTYFARVFGHLNHRSGDVSAPLICDWPNRPKQMVDVENGKKAHTEYEVVEEGLYSSLVRLHPLTGRSHQLRVHMLHIGHPILGDKLYAKDKALSASPRLLLHAQSIAFCHPSTGHEVRFYSPHDFQLEP
ncbi:RluA family pseudouridine synthase [Glaciecola sp. XM2]|uniref:RluA family pseudouridine synthase n=1 Tax=Glaciecola sp. XM2 TaxID=1914931 RepID=UPI001BDDCB9B|nr:RluA family pseudouridine synthase [Glaciecola sp. XM2]MBT1452200.1 RluA family pseudouridine synthase [Glaciecola sp. XM2]